MKPFLIIFLFIPSYFSFSQERKIIDKTYDNGSPSLVYFLNGNNEKTKEISYFPNGKIDYEGNFKNGKEHGKWIYYYEDGQKKFEENYKNGLEDGKQYEWEPDGQLTKLEIYKEGKLQKTLTGKAAEK